MYIVNNNFDIGEECYSVYRKPVHYKCPICDGNGKFLYNGYEIRCTNCNGSGKLHDAKQHIMEVCKVKVRRIIASIFNGTIACRYKTDVIEENATSIISVKNRSETTLFKTKEEAQKYCVDANTKQITPEF